MRIAAGAGKSYELVHEASAFIEACVAYDEATGRFPSDMQIDAVLRPEPNFDRWKQLSEENRRELRAEETIATGVLRAVAARLVGPPVQATRASHLMYEGVNAIFDLRRERDERWAAERRAEAAAHRKPRKPGKAKRAPPRWKTAKATDPSL